MTSVVDSLLPYAEQRYLISGMLYHDYTHALHVVMAVTELVPDAPPHLPVSALYHDAVYIPGAGSDANEKCSAAALAYDWKRIGLSPSTVLSRSQELIKWTSVDHHMTGERMHGEIAILLDADLSSLAARWSTFEENQHNIILENGGTITKQNLQKCGQFLRRFLHVRDCIYHTDVARERWEADAVTNILTWCQKYDVPLSTNV